jgi:hypothetical protein
MEFAILPAPDLQDSKSTDLEPLRKNIILWEL